ncbi:MAG: hypothetical protein WBX01_02435 [Nitrososphaeraceae archaeon]|jgi:hypothetical protein
MGKYILIGRGSIGESIGGLTFFPFVIMSNESLYGIVVHERKYDEDTSRNWFPN